MRPDYPLSPPDGTPDDTPEWERHPIVAKALADVVGFGGSGSDPELALARLLDRAKAVDRMGVRSRSASDRSGSQYRGVSLRTVLTGAALFSAAIVGFVAVRHSLPSSQPRGVVRTYVTGTGQTARVTLDDGTRVTLAPQTTLRAMRSGSNERMLELDGEAYFNVSSSPRAPLVVRTAKADVRVLGTAFDVRSYATESRMRVAVTSGRVAVTSLDARRSSVTLAASHVAEVTDSAIVSSFVPDLATDSAWTAGHLVFHGAPVRDVLTALTRWYGYDFKCADTTLVARKITTWIDTESRAAAFKTLRLVLDVDIAIDGNIVTLKPRQSARKLPATRSPRDTFFTPTREVGR